MARRQFPARNTGKSPPGRVRIVAGKWRGRRLPIAAVPGLRPTSERIRETLFNWLAPLIEGARCLDLFAGTGALGLEALSRGAADVIFVERSVPAVQTLRDSIDILDAATASIQVGDAVLFLQKTEPRQRDIVFLDPPFGDDCLEELCRLLDRGKWLATGASVYLEQDSRQRRPVLPDGWTVGREKRAGNVRYSLVSVTDSGQTIRNLQ